MKVNLKTTNDENAAATPVCHQRGQRTVNGIIGNTRRGIVIDKTLDPDSNNPVANKPVSTALAALAGQLAKGQVVFLDQLPESGEPHKVYVLTATNQRYWWDGNAFVKIVPTASEITPTIDLGNLKKNETYHFASIQDLLNQRLVPYVAASNASAVALPTNGGTFESGSTVSITGITIRAKKGSTEITKAIANDGSKDYEVVIDSSTAKLGDWVETTINFDTPIVVQSDRSGFTWSLSYQGEEAGTIKTLQGTTSSFRFMDKIYWGNAGSVTTSADVLNLTDNDFYSSVSNIGSRGLGRVPRGEYFYIVAVESAGAPIIKSRLGNSAMVDRGPIEVTNASGLTKTFKVYRSANTDISLDGCSILERGNL